MAKKRGDQYFMASVKIGPKGQIVIPKEAREMFGLEPGDTLLLMADKKRGIALQSGGIMKSVVDKIFHGRGSEVDPALTQEQLEDFAVTARDELEDEE